MFILKYGTILNTPRDFLCKIKFFKELFDCAMCLGFWTGIIVATIANFASDGAYFAPTEILLFGLASSFLCLVADLVVEIGDEVKYYLWKNNDKISNQDGRKQVSKD